MKLLFLGTKGEIEEKAKGHKYHSSLLIVHKGFRLLIDHGELSKPLKTIKPDCILISHAHPDHFKWLKKDEPYEGKIYVTKETKRASRFKKNFELMKINKWFKAGPFNVLAYRVIHSLRAPAVGFKIKASGKTGKTLIYNSDLIVMKNKAVLKGVDLYIGDGSCFRANLVRQKNRKLFGHSRMSTQVNWCKKYGIKNIIFTHFGKEPLRIGDRELEKKLRQKGMNIRIAHDEMKITL